MSNGVPGSNRDPSVIEYQSAVPDPRDAPPPPDPLGEWPPPDPLGEWLLRYAYGGISLFWVTLCVDLWTRGGVLRALPAGWGWLIFIIALSAWFAALLALIVDRPPRGAWKCLAICTAAILTSMLIPSPL
jgi:hypothetical protein